MRIRGWSLARLTVSRGTNEGGHNAQLPRVCGRMNPEAGTCNRCKFESCWPGSAFKSLRETVAEITMIEHNPRDWEVLYGSLHPQYLATMKVQRRRLEEELKNQTVACPTCGELQRLATVLACRHKV